MSEAQYGATADKYARMYGLDPALFRRVVAQESGWNIGATSPVGASGLAQVMPATGRDPGYGVRPLAAGAGPEENLRFGAEYLASQIRDQGGDVTRGLQAYNWGPGNLQNWDGNPANMPDETRMYTANILSNAAPSQQQGNNMAGLLGSAPQQEKPAWQERMTGGFLTPDRRDRLAIGLQGMTMNPNEAMMGMAREGIAGRADKRATQEQTNKTVALLERLGADPKLIEMARGGYGAQALQMATTPPKATGRPMTAEQLRAMFPGAEIEDGLYNMKPDGTVSKVGGGGVSVTNNMGGTGDANRYLPGDDFNLPKGYMFDTQTGTAVPIPGGNVAQDQGEAADKAGQRISSARNASNTVFNAGTRAAQHYAALNFGAAGVNVVGMIPGTDSKELLNQVETLKANAAVENINAMRQQSPGGGAVGNASDADIQLLKVKSGALDPTSPNFQRDLDDYVLTLLMTINNGTGGDEMAQELYRQYKAETAQFRGQKPAGEAPQDDGVPTYNPQTRQWE